MFSHRSLLRTVLGREPHSILTWSGDFFFLGNSTGYAFRLMPMPSRRAPGASGCGAPIRLTDKLLRNFFNFHFSWCSVLAWFLCILFFASICNSPSTKKADDCSKPHFPCG